MTTQEFIDQCNRRGHYPDCPVHEDVTTEKCCALRYAVEQINQLRAEVGAWREKAKNWMASPEAAKRLDGYRELAEKLAAKDAEVERLRELMREAFSDYHGSAVLFSSRYIAALTDSGIPDDSQEVRGECVWTYDKDGIYYTSCDNAWVFETGTSEENGARFCIYCGKPITTNQKED